MISRVPDGAAEAGRALPEVVHDESAAVLLVDLEQRAVLFANALAEQLAPGVGLPADLEEWSQRAGLEASDADEPDAPLLRVAAGEPVQGEVVTAARGSDATDARERLWVVGLPLTDAPAPLSRQALVVFLPLRERAAVQRAQEEARDLHSRAVIASDLAFCISDPRVPDNPLVWVNPAFERATGYTADEVLGRNCRFLQGPDTDREAVGRLRKALDAGEPVSEILLNYRADGTAFWNEVVISPVRDATGAVTHHVGVQSDVTHRVRAEFERDAALGEARRARRRLEFLARVTDALSQTLDPEEALQLLPHLVVPDLAQWAFATVLDAKGRPRQVSTSHEDSARSADVRRFQELQGQFLLESSTTLQVLNGTLGPTLIPEVTLDAVRAGVAPDLAPTITTLGLGSALVVPLRARDVITGSLTLLSGEARAPYTEDDLQTAVDLGLRGGLALENARLYAQQRRSSETLQRSLLTPPVSLEDITVVARYVPAAEAAQVGGDWYDAFSQPDGSTVLVIGDVMGHDVSAAAAMGHLRTMVRTLAYDREAGPAEVLDRTDRAMQALAVGTLATAVVAQLRPAGADGRRELRWCRAGHLPPLLLAPDGSVALLGGTGLILGLDAEHEREDHLGEVLPGSTVLLYTDGLVERRDVSMDDRIEELRSALAELAHLPLDELCDALLARMLPGGSDDDVAVVAVHVHPR
ncbi:PAS domain S-box-containing protein [Kineococcus xinjiangensis]|uniref:PAS domain S-box-containing protein n=1 Tax=Kineococcus xinjiangensis TaxID=512762 RepID=A0A2S6IC33_9ACTN|nr:SpoIIE family protein phosphatase [Kineococcus xinjiangensis]PPK90805.1 PAS domain S-box-containing protein [Kineococcus xinjiangensis]